MKTYSFTKISGLYVQAGLLGNSGKGYRAVASCSHSMAFEAQLRSVESAIETARTPGRALRKAARAYARAWGRAL